MMSGLPIALLVTMVALVAGQWISTESNPPTSAITNPSRKTSMTNSVVLDITSGGTKLLKTTVSLSPSTTSSQKLATSTDTARPSLPISVRSSSVNSIMAPILSSVYSSSIETLSSTFFSTANSSSVNKATSSQKLATSTDTARPSLPISVTSSSVNSTMAPILSSVYSSSIQALSSTFFSTANSSSVNMAIGITSSIKPHADKSSSEPISSKLNVKSMSSVGLHVTSQAIVPRQSSKVSNATWTTRSETNNASATNNATPTPVFIPTTTVISISDSSVSIWIGTRESITTKVSISSKSLSMVNTTLIMKTMKTASMVTSTSMVNTMRSFDVAASMVTSTSMVKNTVRSFDVAASMVTSTSMVNTMRSFDVAASMLSVTSTSMTNVPKRSFDVVSTTILSKDVVDSTLTSLVKPTVTSSVFNSRVKSVRNTTVMPLRTVNATSVVTMINFTVTSTMVKAARTLTAVGNTTLTSLAMVNGTITSTQGNFMVNATRTPTTAHGIVSVTRTPIIMVNSTVPSLATVATAGTSVTLIGPVLPINSTVTTVAIENTTMRSVTTSVRSRANSSMKASFFRTYSSSLTSHLRTSSLILPISTSAITSHFSKSMSKPSSSKPPSPSSSTTVVPQTVNQKYRLIIEGNCKEVENVNSVAFKAAVKTAINKILKIDSSRINVLSIVCGSIIADIEIKTVPKDNITKRLTEAVNNNKLTIEFNGKSLAVMSVSTITSKPRDDDNDTAFIIYIVLGTVMGVAFLIAIVALIIRCQRERSAGMFHLPNEEHLELSGFSRNNKSHIHQGNFYGDLDVESGDPEFRARSSEPDVVPFGDDTKNGGPDVSPNVGYLPEWKSLTKLDLSEAGHAGDESTSGNNLLLTYGNKNTEKENEVVGSNDSVRSYDNPST